MLSVFLAQPRADLSAGWLGGSGRASSEAPPCTHELTRLKPASVVASEDAEMVGGARWLYNARRAL